MIASAENAPIDNSVRVDRMHKTMYGETTYGNSRASIKTNEWLYLNQKMFALMREQILGRKLFKVHYELSLTSRLQSLYQSERFYAKLIQSRVQSVLETYTSVLKQQNWTTCIVIMLRSILPLPNVDQRVKTRDTICKTSILSHLTEGKRHDPMFLRRTIKRSS